MFQHQITKPNRVVLLGGLVLFFTSPFQVYNNSAASSAQYILTTNGPGTNYTSYSWQNIKSEIKEKRLLGFLLKNKNHNFN